jgi:hypothetical protein
MFDWPWHCVLCGKFLDVNSEDSLAARMTSSHDLVSMCSECARKVQPEGVIIKLFDYLLSREYQYKIRKTKWGERFMPSKERTELRKERARIRALHFGKSPV